MMSKNFHLISNYLKMLSYCIISIFCLYKLILIFLSHNHLFFNLIMLTIYLIIFYFILAIAFIYFFILYFFNLLSNAF